MSDPSFQQNLVVEDEPIQDSSFRGNAAVESIPTPEPPIAKTQKPHVEPVQHLCSAANSTATSLIYWENPLHSVVVLALGLAACSLFYYYSVSSIYAAVAFFVLFGNWLYVLGYKQLQHLLGGEPKHPFERHILERSFIIHKDLVEKHSD
ncbi:7735_t:CDS:2, partial [Paraglomus occultum]